MKNDITSDLCHDHVTQTMRVGLRSNSKPTVTVWGIVGSFENETKSIYSLLFKRYSYLEWQREGQGTKTYKKQPISNHTKMSISLLWTVGWRRASFQSFAERLITSTIVGSFLQIENYFEGFRLRAPLFFLSFFKEKNEKQNTFSTLSPARMHTPDESIQQKHSELK